MLSRVRQFFGERDVLEVETPALSKAGVTDLHLESVSAKLRSLGVCYLHTSPEYAMKRLLAAGSGDIYQICRVYRDGELGRWHQPEFTLLEWYRVGFDESMLMDEVERLLGLLLSPAGVRRTSYGAAFRELLGIDPHADLTALPAALRGRGIDVPDALEPNALLDLAFAEAIGPSLDPAQLTFIYDFPASQAALARVKPGNPPVAARFEAFAGGLELANGFAELTDPREQRARFQAELEQRRRQGRPMPPLDEAFLADLEHLPPCAGVAVGLDRVVAVAGRLGDVASAMSFAHVAADGRAPRSG
jgi:elongation factor P--(R)-beta-lysine ligase